jgi:TRAP-type C4-dicarboxylate transport system substrate-binding protein
MKKALSVILCLVLSGLGAYSLALAAPAEKVVELRLSHWLPSTHLNHRNVFVPFAQAVEKKTGGRVKVTIFPSETLGKGKAHYDMVRTGAADMGLFFTSYHPGMFLLTDLLTLPFTLPTAVQGSKIYAELFKKGYFDQEYKEVKVIGTWTSDSYKIFLAKKKVMNLKDISGLKVRTPGGAMTPMLTALGAVPVSLSSSEIYTVMEKGIIEGGMLPIGSIPSFKLQEVTKYVIDLGCGISVFAVMVNKGVWNGLPKDVQKIFEEVGDEVTRWGGNAYDSEATNGKEILKKAGVEVYALAPAEEDKWKKATKGVWVKKIEDTEKSKVPTKKFMDEFLGLMRKEGVQPPL